MKQTKKTIAVGAIIAALFLVCAIRGASAAAPTWMPSNTQLAGYTMVWDNTISVQWITDKDVNGNVTCSSQVWLKNGTSGMADANVIGASMIDKGGDVLNKGIDLSKNDIGTIAARAILSGAGLNQSQIDGIKNVWDICVEILRVHQGSTYNLTEPVVPNVDNAVMLEFAPSNNFTYVLFTTRQDHCMVVYSFDASQDWIDWLNATGTGSLILARMQAITWAFWVILAAYVTVIVGLANFLGVSDAPAAVAESALPATPALSASSAVHVNAIGTSAFTQSTDLTAFAAAWGALFPNFPWWIVIVVVVGAVFAIVLIAVLVRKRRNK